MTNTNNNNMTFKKLCQLFCCPPWPGSITAKLAFMPPPPSYDFRRIESTEDRYAMVLKDGAHWIHSQSDLQKLEGFFVRTRRGNKIACLYVKCTSKPRFIVLFSHGNAVDLGLCSGYYIWLGTNLKCDILSYDYSGYGISGGSPYESNLYLDIAAVWRTLKLRYNASPENIILYGYSIGTVPTIRLAAKERVAGVVIHSGLMSGLRVAFPHMTTTLCCDPFPSVERVRKIRSPTLVIHGTDDEIIDFSHGLGLHDRCPAAVEPLWVDGGGHNDLEFRTVFLERLKRFLSDEVDRSAAAPSGDDFRLIFCCKV
ncbi:alpha/beta hydrolase domain-containing protein 17B-like [Coccinella septempunctata]|uniref:alpha/beta hydrolase domain-containing protein 17B-like n=1 Tax=Coccinella septempunctata TaxID=41139 RepID=UPI001D095BEA|nr:alpha/beta hydrolase domain-containing protein 17B-like [Coccinella septempunctata]XP_044756065.1 alpha/beta hydrolase domain-containing protein 17B-like [Coccinella septempunctata]XP_044756066.1 alpha/beta hydrolase domain-containing protein 17B-like [Coccinella septempunctata]